MHNIYFLIIILIKIFLGLNNANIIGSDDNMQLSSTNNTHLLLLVTEILNLLDFPEIGSQNYEKCSSTALCKILATIDVDCTRKNSEKIERKKCTFKRKFGGKTNSLHHSCVHVPLYPHCFAEEVVESMNETIETTSATFTTSKQFGQTTDNECNCIPVKDVDKRMEVLFGILIFAIGIIIGGGIIYFFLTTSKYSPLVQKEIKPTSSPSTQMNDPPQTKNENKTGTERGANGSTKIEYIPTPASSSIIKESVV